MIEASYILIFVPLVAVLLGDFYLKLLSHVAKEVLHNKRKTMGTCGIPIILYRSKFFVI